VSDDTKPRVEVVEESQESLSILDLDRTPRPEKMRRESSYFDGAHEVHFTERAFKPRHDATLDEVRAFVDALEVRRREIAPLPAPEPVPVASAAPRIPDHYREPLERVIAGALVSVETVHRVGTGTVVDVAWEPADGGLRRGLFLVKDGDATPYDDVASRIDALPTPAARAPEFPEVPAPAPAAAPLPPPEKKGLMGRFGKKKEPEAQAPPPEPAAEKKRRFGFGKK
jgi:hypothetical protein